MNGNQVLEIGIREEGDIVLVRKKIRQAASDMGFGGTDITRIVTAASELARNIFKYAGTGDVTVGSAYHNGREGIQILFVDQGPGIENVEMAQTPGYTTAKGLGMGLPGARRLMDEMEIRSVPGEGTRIMVIKWLM